MNENLIFFIVNFRQENDSLREDLIGSKNKCDNLQQELHQVSGKLEESFHARKETEKLLKSKSREVENLKTKIKEVLSYTCVKYFLYQTSSRC